MRWRYALSIDVPVSANIITGSNGRIYAAMAKYDTVYALSTDLGSLVWQAKVGPLSEASSIPVVDLLGAKLFSWRTSKRNRKMNFPL